MTRQDDALHARAAAGDPVAMTQLMVATPSVNPLLEEGGTGETEMALLTAEWLTSWGYEVETVPVAPGRPNVIATLGSEGPHLLLNGHLDTVGVAGMTVDPFGADSSDHVLVGRGSADMKSGLAVILAAAHAFAVRRERVDGGASQDGQLTVALTCDEEHASVGMQALVGDGCRADLAVVTEPTSLAVMPAHKGFAWVEVTFNGRAAHGSRPEVGVDAVLHAAAFLHDLSRLQDRLDAADAHPLLGHGSFHAGTIQGGTAWSVYPDRCSVTLERRTLPGEDGADFLEEVESVLRVTRARITDLDATTRLDLVRPPSDVASSHPLVEGLLKAIRDEGVEPRVEGMTAWVDAAYLNQVGVPAVCFGPGSIAHAHSADESVSADEIRKAASILTRFTLDYLADWAGGDPVY